MDENGLFFCGSNKKALLFKCEEFKGGKLSKKRITVVLCANLEEETTIII
jgi:hypothetical protein